MELDKNLVNLQGTLYSFWMQGLLNKPGTLHQVLQGIREITENVPDEAKSKLTFLMVLYTRLAVSEKLSQDNFVGQYIHDEPYFEKEYLIIYVYHLNLQKQLFRVIENCPGVLGIELLDRIMKKLKEPDFCQVEFGLAHFYQLWQSVFVKLCKLEKKFHKESSTEKFATSFLNVYDLIQEVVVSSMTDDTEFNGMHLYYFFKTLLYCVKFQKTPDVANDQIYELSIELDCSKDMSVCENAMRNCLEKVFQKIPNILERLTLDMWVFFSECYCSEDPKNSVQFLIGDLVYHILKEVKEEKYNVPSDVLGFFSSISIDKEELIAKAGISEIISNIRKGGKEWFKVLVRHSDVTTYESVECLIDHLELADSDDLSVILNTSYKYMHSVEKDDMDVKKKLFFTALKKTPDYEQWLVKIFDNYQPNLAIATEANEELIKTFNKISSGKSIPHSDLIVLCIQSPLETIKKICHIAVYGSEQMELAVEILKLLKCPCNVRHLEDFTVLDYALLKSLLEEVTGKEKQLFVDLVICLGKENILKTSFNKNLLKCLKEYLESESLEKAVLCLEILKATLNLKVFEFHKTALLVFMSQVFGHFSWDLRSFSILKADGREQADSIVNLIINCLEQTENGSDLLWARQEILRTWEVNQAYFCDLWFKFNISWPCSGTFNSLMLALAHSQYKTDDLRNVLINFDQPFEVRVSIILSLTMLLPVLSFQKWKSLFHQLIVVWGNINSEKYEVYHDVLDMFGSALQLLSMNLKHDVDTYTCFKYCLRNYAKLAKQCCTKMNERSIVRTFEKIFVFLSEIEDEGKRKSCWEIFPSLLMELVDCLKKKNGVDAHRMEIEELLPLLDLKDVADGLTKTLH